MKKSTIKKIKMKIINKIIMASLNSISERLLKRKPICSRKRKSRGIKLLKKRRN